MEVLDEMTELLGAVLLVFLTTAVIVAIWTWIAVGELRNERDLYVHRDREAMHGLETINYRLYCAQHDVEPKR